MSEEIKPPQRPRVAFRRIHLPVDAYKSEDNVKMFSDITHGHWDAATRLHRLAANDAATRTSCISPLVPSVVGIYCTAADCLLNSILGRIHLITRQEDLIESSYTVAISPFCRQKVEEFAYVLQVPELCDTKFLYQIAVLSNVRNEVFHFVPVPSKRSQWRRRVLEAVRAAGIKKSEMHGIDWAASLGFIKLADWARTTVLSLSRTIEHHMKWPPQLYFDEKAGELGCDNITAQFVDISNI
ncbi:hypothetical protein [Azospirillum sp. ST 5-10]|uniref:hypothetical protein n=1 Tax=unclassified Azospirillum TaxID=2630922 RepID=UPI003F4A3E3A